MKRKYFKGMTGFITTIRIGCVASIGMMATQTQAGTPEPAPVPVEPEVAANWVDFTVGGAFTGGDQAAYQRRVGQDGDFYGGISDMHWEQEANDITWTLDGHAMFGNEDYEVVFGAEKEGLGYVKAGFSQFRTWYDGSGGYLPITNGWFDVDDDLHLDRGEVWFETGLRKENFPEITFGYSHGWRDGEKDSTSWGLTTDLIPPISTSANRQDYKIAPSRTVIDEETDTFTLDVAHTLGSTDLDLGLSYKMVNNEDTRIMGSAVSPTDPKAGNTVKDTAAYDLDLFNSHLSSETRFGEKVIMSFGYSFTTLDTDIGGDRPSIDNTSGAVESAQDHALFGIIGGAQSQIHVLNANLWWNPVEDLVIVPSIRAEFENQNAWSNHIAGVRTNPNATDAEIAAAVAGGALPYARRNNYDPDGSSGPLPTGSYNVPTLSSDTDHNGVDVQEFAESLEIRYNGIENTVLYGEAEFIQADIDTWRWASIVEREVVPFPDVPDLDTGYGTRSIESDLEIQKYTLGTNWYPIRGLSFSAQAYYRNSDQDFTNRIDNSLGGEEDAQIDQHNSETTDFNLRMTWRALPNVTFVTRYDYQQTEIENRGINAIPVQGETTLDLIESADIESHIISQSVTWMPLDRMYVQGMVSYVMSETDTPADKYAPQRMEDSDNDYLMANLTVGYAIDQKTDLTAGYSFYYCENYDIPYATTGNPGSVGYGTDLEEHVLSIRLNRWINPNMVWNVGYGYYNSNDGTFGGNNSFDAHMVSTGLQVRF